MSYTIIFNSSTDLPESFLKEFKLKLLPLKFNIKEETYVNYLDHRDLGIVEFYDKLRGGELATTSQVNVYEYEEAIQEEVDKGKDVLILSFSSGLSGSYNAARLAVDNFKDSKQKVLLVDTKAASLGEGLLVYLVAQYQASGKSIIEAYEYANYLVPHIGHWFTVDDLMFLKRGGRVSGTSARIGTLLRVKPVMHVDDEGKLIVMSKALGRKKALGSLLGKLKETIDTKISNLVFISHGDALEEALYLKEEVLKYDASLDVKIINHIGPVIGAHAGPGTMALFFAATHK